MSGVSEVVSNRDRARLRLKESIMELAAARGQEDDVIGKLIVKVNEVFNALVDSHVEMVLGLGENLSNEIHENFMYEASDERDEAVEKAEEEKVKAEESIKVNNLALMGKKDREEFLDEKLEISRKVSQEEAESELFCMFSAWVNLQDARPDAPLQGGEVPHEASRALNRANSIKQKLPSIPEEIFDGDIATSVTEVLHGAPGQVSCAGSCDVTGKPSKQEPGGLKLGVKIHHEVEAIADDEFHDPGEKLANKVINAPNSFKLYDAEEELFGKLFYMEKPSNEAAEDVCEHVKQTFGVSRVTEDTAEEADCEAIKEEINAREFTSKEGVEKTAEVAEENVKEKSPVKFAGTSHAHGLPRSVEFYDPGEELFGDMPQSKGLARLNITFNDWDPARLNLSGLTCVRKSVEDIGLGITYDHGEKLFVNKPWSKSFARLKLTGTIYLEKCAGGITLIVKAEFSRKGIGDSSLFERAVFIARSSVDTVPVFMDNKQKVPEATRLKEENSQK